MLGTKIQGPPLVHLDFRLRPSITARNNPKCASETRRLAWSGFFSSCMFLANTSHADTTYRPVIATFGFEDEIRYEPGFAISV
jgi:hypothetical protein